MAEISCGVVRDLLPLHAENITSEESRALVEAHLERCGLCQAELAALREPPQVQPKAEESMRHVKRRLHRMKLAAITVALCSMLVALAIAFFATSLWVIYDVVDAEQLNFALIDDAEILVDGEVVVGPGFAVNSVVFIKRIELNRATGEDGVEEIEMAYVLGGHQVLRQRRDRSRCSRIFDYDVPAHSMRIRTTRVYFRPANVLDENDHLWLQDVENLDLSALTLLWCRETDLQRF